jgi:hypothetical protein
LIQDVRGLFPLRGHWLSGGEIRKGGCGISRGVVLGRAWAER